MRSLRTWCVALAVVVTGAVAALSAHPQSTTEVAIEVGSGRTVTVEITADADPLARKLEALSAAPLGRVRVDNLAAWSDVLIEHIQLRADGQLLPLVWTGAAPIAAGRVVVTLQTLLPADAGTVTWSSSLVFGAYPVTVRRGSTQAPTQWLQGLQMSEPFPLASTTQPQWLRDVVRHFLLGFTHILPNGLDHILFVLGLFLLSRRWNAVLLQVSAFTIAHSITLGLTLYGKASLPPSVVEPLIAISIAYVAIENLFTTEVKSWRVALVFLFGLLHGMGFAEALASLHLPRSEFLGTLVMFNVGVEAGQLTVIAAAALIVAAVRIQPADYRRLVARPASLAIAGAGLFWTVTRLWQG